MFDSKVHLNNKKINRIKKLILSLHSIFDIPIVKIQNSYY